MKAILLGLLLMGTFSFFVFSPPPLPTPTPFSLPKEWSQKIEFTHEEEDLVIVYAAIPDKSSFVLIPNFSQKETGARLVEKNQCDYAVNGGFYQENHLPLGLFFSQGKKHGQEIKGSVADGFFWQDKKGNRFLGKEHPDLSSLDFIFQSGPIFFPQESPLKMAKDEKERRILLAKDKTGRLYFLALFAKDNHFRGPLLSSLPQIFASLRQKEILPFSLILNLDGGTASYFYAKENEEAFSLSELSFIGSLLCVKKINQENL